MLGYYRLARQLGHNQAFYGLWAVGLDGEAEPYTQTEAMAAAYISAMQAVQPRGPYLLGGWSLGGVVAFETARQLSSQGHEAGLLALIDSWAQSYFDRGEPADLDDIAVIASFAADLGSYRVEA